MTAQKFAEIAMADTASAADAEGIYVAILEKQLTSMQIFFVSPQQMLEMTSALAVMRNCSFEA